MSENAYFSSVRTVSEKEELVSALDHLIETTYQTIQLPWKQTFSKLYSQKTIQLLEGILQSFNITEPTSKDAQTFGNILKVLKTFKVLRLTTSFEPSEAFLTKLHTFSKTIYISILLDIIVDPTIVGGVVLEFEGLHEDYTLNTLIDMAFEKRKEEIKQLLG